MKRKHTAQSAPARRTLDEGGFFNLRASIAVFLCGLVGCSLLSATLLGFFSPQAPLKVSERTLSFAERVTYQRAIEDVCWRHRIWPEERANPKPPLESVMSRAQVEKKVADYLRKSQALEDHWQRARSPLISCKLRWIAWRLTPNSLTYCANSSKRSGTIPLLSPSVWRGQSRRNVYSLDWMRTKQLTPSQNSRGSLMRRRKRPSQSQRRGG